MAHSELEDARASLFILSSLAGLIQKSHGLRSANPNSVRSQSQSRQGRIMNHLATLFTRGTRTELNQVVAVAAGPNYAQHVDLIVLSNSPPSSTTVSPSTSQSGEVDDDPSSDSQRASTSQQEPAPTSSDQQYQQGESLGGQQQQQQQEPVSAGAVSNFVISMNPNANHVSKRDRAENNTSNAHETLIKLFQAFHANIKHQKPFTADFAVKATFPHYLKTAISVLQLTTAWRRDPLSRPNGITDGEAYTAAALFFTANCLGKIRQRAGQFSRVYGDALATWRAVPADNVSSSPIKVTLPFLQRQLQRLCIDKTSTEEFLFDQGSAHLWLQAITDIVDRILKRSDAGDIIQVIKETDALHRFLKILNADQACNLWRLPSLEASLDFQFTKSSSRKEGEKDAEDGFEEGCIEAQAEHSLPALPHAKVFTRAVDAICAWTTATQVLTSRRYIGPKTAIKLQLIKLPRESLKQLSASSLLLRWMRTSQHVDYNSLKDWLKKLDVKRTYLDAGAEHCEAGLMAGLIAGAQLRDREELEGAFDDSRIEWEGSSASTAIGVGKKCCPVCALLAHTILTKRAIRFELPGQHAEYRAWVPPRFTPLDILLAMEGQLLEKVGEMMQQQNLHTSRPSSPASDSNPVGLLTDDIPDES